MTSAPSVSTRAYPIRLLNLAARSAPILVWTFVAGMALLGLLLVGRWAAGAFQTQLPPAILFPLVVSLAAILRLTRDVWRLVAPRQPLTTSWSEQLVGWCPSLSLVVIAVTVSYPGGRTIDWLAWLPLIVLDQFWRQSFFDGGLPSVEQSAEPGREEAGNDQANVRESSQCLQQTTRLRTEAGEVIVRGTLIAEFEPRQRQQSIHVAFCPPFRCLPVVETATSTGPSAKVKLSQLLPHGARFDVRLTAPAAEATTVVVHFAAAEPPD